MYPGVPRVDVHMQADWHEKHILLKVAFPLNVHSDKATLRFLTERSSVRRRATRLPRSRSSKCRRCAGATSPTRLTASRC